MPSPTATGSTGQLASMSDPEATRQPAVREQGERHVGSLAWGLRHLLGRTDRHHDRRGHRVDRRPDQEPGRPQLTGVSTGRLEGDHEASGKHRGHELSPAPSSGPDGLYRPVWLLMTVDARRSMSLTPGHKIRISSRVARAHLLQILRRHEPLRRHWVMERAVHHQISRD